MELSKEFEVIPGVGPSISKAFHDLGYKSVTDLKGGNPEEMYEKLIDIRNKKIDRCVLYVFRLSVYYSNNKVHKPELLKWWNWKEK